LNDKSRMKREFHVRFCERLEGWFLLPTRLCFPVILALGFINMKLQNKFSELVETNFYTEIGYKLLFWLSIGAIFSVFTIYNGSLIEINKEMNEYIKKVMPLWDRNGSIVILLGVFILSVRHIEFIISNTKLKDVKIFSYSGNYILGFILKIYHDFSLGAFGLGSAILGTILLLPVYLETNPNDMFIYFYMIFFFSVALLLIGSGISLTKFDHSHILLRWQKKLGAKWLLGYPFFIAVFSYMVLPKLA